jgi:hypothetical protein
MGPDAVAVGDFNGDGKLDVAVTNLVDGTVSILLGNGDGTFQAAQSYAVGLNPSSVALGDLNGDGSVDLAVANNGGPLVPGTVSILLGNGNGTFKAAVAYQPGLVNFVNFETGDFSQAATHTNGSIVSNPALDGNFSLQLQRNNSVANYEIRQSGTTYYNVPTAYYQFLFEYTSNPAEGGVANFLDNTGGLKAALHLSAAGKLLFYDSSGTLQGTGNTALAAGQAYVISAKLGMGANGAWEVRINGTVDLSGSNNLGTNNNGSLKLGGDGQYTSTYYYDDVAINALSYPGQPNFVAVGDFNRDGHLDLAVADKSSGNVLVFLGNGDGTFQAAQGYAVGAGPQSIAVGDLNRDGNPDLAVANMDGTVSVLLGNGDGTFKPMVNYAAGKQPSSVAIGDFNKDGFLDLAVTNLLSNTVSILLGNGDGTFQAAQNYAVTIRPVAVAVADFNGDGFPDVVVANNVPNTTGTATVLFNAADWGGGSAAVPPSALSSPARTQPVLDVVAAAETQAVTLVPGTLTSLQPSPAPQPLTTQTSQSLTPDATSSQTPSAVRQVRDAAFEQWSDWTADLLASDVSS